MKRLEKDNEYKDNKYYETTEKLYENKFNIVILGIIDFVSNSVPDSFFNKNNKKLHTFISKYSESAITNFIQYIYSNDEYRVRLRSMDDRFFIEQDFNTLDIKSTHIKKLFYFKDLWINNFDDESKMLIKKSMKTLINISEKYINTLYEKNVGKYKKINNKVKIKKKKRKQHYNIHNVPDKCYDIDSISVGSYEKSNKNNSDYDIDSISIGT
jgi:hypothetical protein